MYLLATLGTFISFSEVIWSFWGYFFICRLEIQNRQLEMYLLAILIIFIFTNDVIWFLGIFLYLLFRNTELPTRNVTFSHINNIHFLLWGDVIFWGYFLFVVGIAELPTRSVNFSYIRNIHILNDDVIFLGIFFVCRLEIQNCQLEMLVLAILGKFISSSEVMWSFWGYFLVCRDKLTYSTWNVCLR